MFFLLLFFSPPLMALSLFYIHSVFMPADNKGHGSIHAGGGVTGNSWQLFKYLLFCLLLFFASRLWSRLEKKKGRERREEGGKGVNQPPTSISNSLCSPHASRGSDLTLARRKKQILYNVSQRDGASGLMSRLGCKHPARAVEESRRRSRGVKLLLSPRGTLRKWPKTVLLSHYFVTFSLL